MRTKLLSIILTVCMIFSVCQFTMSASAAINVTVSPTLTADTEQGLTGFSFNATGVGANDWVGIMRADVNNHTTANWADWVYAKEGETTFPSGSRDRYRAGLTQPADGWILPPGDWKLVVYLNNSYNVAQEIPFTVEEMSSNAPATNEYYVKFGGTGDGLSAESPLGSIPDLITKINEDGHNASSEVTVYVIDSGEAEKTVIDSDCVLGYHYNEAAPTHRATIKYKSYNPDVKSIISYVKYGGASYAGEHLILKGPSIFENIKILDMRTDSGVVRDFYVTNNSAKFIGSEFIDLDTGANAGKIITARTHFSVGGCRVNAMTTGDCVIDIDDATITGDYLSLSGYTDANKSQGINGDVIVRIGGGTLKNFHMNISKGNETVNGNASLVLAPGVVVQNVRKTTSSTTMTINGAFQLVKNYGVTFPASHDLETTYELDVKSPDVTLDVTENAGIFTVSGTKIAYAVSEDKKTIFYGDSTLSLVPGKYEVFAADTVEEIIANAEAPIVTASYSFDGWNSSVAGKITAILTFIGENNGEYYVKWGGTGDGLSHETPLPDVAAAIKQINLAGYTKGDDVTIYIMDDGEEPWKYAPDGTSLVGKLSKGGNLVAKATTWADSANNQPEAWTANIRVTSYDYQNTNKLAHIMWTKVVGSNERMIIGGPIVLENVGIINPRAYDREIFTNGNNITFRDVKIYHLNACFASGGNYDGKLYEGHPRIMQGGSAVVDGGNVVIDTAINSSDSYGIYVGAYGDVTNRNHVTITLANSQNTMPILWGEKNTVFNNGLSIVIDGAKVKGFTKRDSANTIINGGYELIAYEGDAVFGYTIPDNTTINGGTWKIKVNGDSMFISPTDKTGTYKAIDGMEIIASGEDGNMYISTKGQITLPEGTYTVESIPSAEIADLVVENVTFDDVKSDIAFICGRSTYLPTLPDRVHAKFIGWDLEGDHYDGGAEFYVEEGVTDLVFISEWEPKTGIDYVFVDQANGSDGNNGQEPSRAVKNLGTAFTMLKDKTNERKLIIIVGKYNLDGPVAKNVPGKYIITGDGSGESAIDINNECAQLYAEVTIENIKLVQTTTKVGKVLAIEHMPITIGEGVTVDNKFVMTLGGFDHGIANNSIIANFNSGTFGNVRIGDYWHTTRKTLPSVHVKVDGTAKLNGLAFHSDKYSDSQVGVDYSGPVTVEINGGSVGKISVTTASENAKLYASFKDTVQILINNGVEVAVDNDFVADKGVWIVKAAKVEGSKLSLTDTAGVFSVVGTNTAIATDTKTGNQFVSSEGVLSLSPGSYTVDFVDKIYFISNGESIEIRTDCQIDLNTMRFNEKPDHLFIGWTMADGTPCKLIDSYKAGDIIKANYVPFKSYNEETGDGDFYIKGAQIRTTGVQGLRFVVEKKNSFAKALPNVAEFGTLVLPTAATWGRSMFLDQKIVKEWGWDTETRMKFTPKSFVDYTPSKVVGARLFARTSDAEQYTVCITGIDQSKYYRYYSVRAYLKFTDYNGNEQIIYSDYYQTNLYRVALAAIEANEEPAATFEGIKNYVEIDRKNAYMAQNYDNRVLKTGYSTTEDKDPNHKMYTLANGLKVREVEIDSGLGGDPVEIIHFADTHLNYINERDLAEGNVNTLSSYRGRSWYSNGASIPAIMKAMEYASFFDKAVITGDIMDYFSWGCAEIMQKMIVDQSHGDVLLAMGNHEPAELMQQDLSGLSNMYTREEKYEVLQSIWPHDIYYHSDIVKNDDGTDKVMLVVLDNQADVYWGDIQAVPFARDIEIARSKNIPILVFQHDPICTRNPAETSATYFGEPGDLSGIPWNMSTSFAGKVGSNENTMKVYNLIVKNPDVIKGVFCGHWHNNMYTEILAQNEDGSFMKDGSGNNVVIPQHVVTANAYGNGNVIKITVK